ncbi:Lipoprotein [Burkholderia sp. IT-111MI5]
MPKRAVQTPRPYVSAGKLKARAHFSLVRMTPSLTPDESPALP